MKRNSMKRCLAALSAVALCAALPFSAAACGRWQSNQSQANRHSHSIIWSSQKPTGAFQNNFWAWWNKTAAPSQSPAPTQSAAPEAEPSQKPVQSAEPTPSAPAESQIPAESAAPVESTPPAETQPEDTSTYETAILSLVNAERAKYGLSALTLDASLSKVAQAKAQDLHDNHYFAHESPTYGTPFEMMRAFGISYRSAGENIAMGYSSAQAVMTGWMNSEGHRANILNASYTTLGVGYVADGNYWVQMFIS
jgi:uncharacterized YkwD family protein